MKYKDRAGNKIIKNSAQDKFLKWLYSDKAARKLLKILVHPAVSKAGGWFLNQRCSKIFIAPFIKSHRIDLSIYEQREFCSYNDFFTRQIKKEQRPLEKDDNILISPCDGKLSIYPIDKKTRFWIKNTEYTVKSLVRSESLAKQYQDGYACIFRLTVDDYHRYCYVDDGKKTRNYHISGIFHTVNPIANEKYCIYKENTREYSLLKSKHFKTILMMEVGALMVGKITNYQEKGIVKRGEEKGRFEFGGSTIVLLFQKDAVNFDKILLENTMDGYETIVKMGEGLGKKSGAL